MSEDYEYDLFISYIRQEPVLTWLNLYFAPMLKERLKGELPYDPEIFIDDESLRKGSNWHTDIQEALQKSRILVPIWSAEYFRSNWCVAEWQSIMKRQELVNHKNNISCCIIFPVKFGDGDFFHDKAKETQMEDLSGLNYKAVTFEKSEKFMEFEKKIENIAKKLSKRIIAAPAWSSTWPIYSPDCLYVKKIINECKLKARLTFKRPRI